MENKINKKEEKVYSLLPGGRAVPWLSLELLLQPLGILVGPVESVEDYLIRILTGASGSKYLGWCRTNSRPTYVYMLDCEISLMMLSSQATVYTNI